jgi:hypothetical protein
MIIIVSLESLVCVPGASATPRFPFVCVYCLRCGEVEHIKEFRFRLPGGGVS